MTRKTGLFRPAGHVSNSNNRSAVHGQRSRDQIWRRCKGQPLGGQLFPRVAVARSIDEQQDNPIWFIFMSTPAFNSCRSRGRTRHCAYRVIPREETAPTIDRNLVFRAYETSANRSQELAWDVAVNLFLVSREARRQRGVALQTFKLKRYSASGAISTRLFFFLRSQRPSLILWNS